MPGSKSPDRGSGERPELHLVAPIDDETPVGDAASDAAPTPGDGVAPSRSRDGVAPSRSRDGVAPSRPRDGVAPSAAAVQDARALLSSADPVAYYRSLSNLVRTGHHAVLQPLPYTPALEFHDPSCVVVEPRPGNVETVELYANAAYPAFEEVFRPVFRDPAVAAELTGLFHLVFGEGANVAVVTNHGQIIDIALVMGAMILGMCEPGREFGVLGEQLSVPDLADRINVMVSRMVTTRQAFNVPAMQVLQCGSRTFLSMPQTHSRRRAKLDPAMVKANNLLVRHELDTRLARGGQLLAMAASGSQDLSLAASMVQKVRSQWRARRGIDPGETSTLHLQPLYDGTMQLMLGCRYVLPIAVSLEPAAPAVVVGSLTQVRDTDDCHGIMDWIADAHQGATRIPTIYHRQEDQLLRQVRTLVKS